MTQFILDKSSNAMKDLAEASYVLGCHIARNSSEWLLELNQPAPLRQGYRGAR